MTTKDAEGARPQSRLDARPHEWVHFKLGRTCARCGLTLTNDEPDAPTECGAAHKTREKPSAKGA